MHRGRILGDDVHEEVEPHDRHCQPNHRDLEELCGEKGQGDLSASRILGKNLPGFQEKNLPAVVTAAWTRV